MPVTEEDEAARKVLERAQREAASNRDPVRRRRSRTPPGLVWIREHRGGFAAAFRESAGASALRTAMRGGTQVGRVYARVLFVLSLGFCLLGIATAALGNPPPGARPYPIDARRFQVLARDSGPTSYYWLVDDPSGPFIRGIYKPPLETVTLFADVGDGLRKGVDRIRFRWRAWVLPVDGNECVPGKGDAAANVYVAWKRGLRWYSVKLAWSTTAPLGASCAGIRNPLVATDTIILRSGPPTGVWQEEEIDPDALFRAHFEGGNPAAEVPELQGVGMLTDGDQTHSMSAADYAGFVLYKRVASASR